MFVSDVSGDHMVEFQTDTACTRLECYRHLYKLCQHNPTPRDGGPDSVFGQAGRRSMPHD